MATSGLHMSSDNNDRQKSPRGDRNTAHTAARHPYFLVVKALLVTSYSCQKFAGNWTCPASNLLVHSQQARISFCGGGCIPLLDLYSIMVDAGRFRTLLSVSLCRRLQYSVNTPTTTRKRTVSAPLAWNRRLPDSTPSQCPRSAAR